MVSGDGIAVDEEKVKRIMEWPTPKNGREVSSFLGLASYYRRFISQFARIAGPLHKVSAKKKQTKKSLYGWNDEQETSFKALKESLIRVPVLAYPCFDKEIDASGKGLGACLSQRDDVGRLHPVAYASGTLRGGDRNYPDFSSFKIELLAQKWAVVDKFVPYIQGRHCEVFTDHNPLVHLKSAKLGATETRWVAQLAAFDLDVKYRPGRSNRNALSRVVDMSDEEITAMVNEVTGSTSLLPCDVLQDSILKHENGDGRPVFNVLPPYSYEELAKMQENVDVLGEVRRLWKEKWKRGHELEMENVSLRSWLKEWKNYTEFSGVLYREIGDPLFWEKTTTASPTNIKGDNVEPNS